MCAHRTSEIVTNSMPDNTTMSFTTTSTESGQSHCDPRSCAITVAMTVASTMVAFSILNIVVLILIYNRKRQTAPINLTKHHKESDENSYTSSKHSHESGSKSPDPEYDVIKINPSTDKLEAAHFVKSKTCQVYSSMQSSVLKHEEDWDCGPMYSSVDTNTGGPHKIGDFNVNSAIYSDIESHTEVNADDIIDDIMPSNDTNPTRQSNDAAPEKNSVKPHIYAEVDVKKKKVHNNEISKEFAVKGDEDSNEGSIPPPVPPQTTEMLYVTIQNENGKEKVN